MMSWTKNIKNYSDHPIIYTTNDNCYQKNLLKEIIKVCKCIEIKYSDVNFIDRSKNY